MDKDWKPIDYVVADETCFMNYGTYLHEAKSSLIGRPDTADIKLWDENARRDFPNLSYMLSGFELSIYGTLSGNPFATEVYREIESELAELSDTVRKRCHTDKDIRIDDDDIVTRWFLGKLDPNFCYRERNDEKLMAYITEQIEAKQKRTDRVPTAKVRKSDCPSDEPQVDVKSIDSPGYAGA